MEKKFKVTVDGKLYEVIVEDVSETGSNLYPSPGLRANIVNTAPATAAAPAEQANLATGADELPSPLSGVIVEIAVSPGATVVKGDKVIVVEAMKMKTMVSAHKSGKIASIAVAVGDGVESGQALMVIK
ncbi:MAG: acetyl-CoA carboxylase biotin carboxyl carrier protein subunit [Chromatiaceae bacterium]|nr:acetyl-CoA carboxylase biotin carboxyl carrier protein subunit [Gammaproteobacteria bacterium]MCB1879546.1 acetyl-CoA carboxylase biotin carboxyl carrier protein subunit [Gammaproteobacteria bacterium]MCB1902919.1 acetyl-CoA carboxylase biotin carboxyl carrier protein subunit [Gammaproteobacteria bacterium]MCP5445736.1 acetyl-CoA carboxylase biotin carboxyl carrier protein subunit [Chromatiaceae bacterium]